MSCFAPVVSSLTFLLKGSFVDLDCIFLQSKYVSVTISKRNKGFLSLCYHSIIRKQIYEKGNLFHLYCSNNLFHSRYLMLSSHYGTCHKYSSSLDCSLAEAMQPRAPLNQWHPQRCLCMMNNDTLNIWCKLSMWP